MERLQPIRHNSLDLIAHLLTCHVHHGGFHVIFSCNTQTFLRTRPNTPPPLHSPLSLSSRPRSWPSEIHRKETGFPAKDDPIARSICQTMGATRAAEMGGRCPVLLFDVMGTIVRDPFYEDVPAFFGISMKELLMIKHPTAWIEFEKGLISEEELNANFFKDKRGFDSSGLKACMANGYAYLEGVEALLGRLKSRGYRMHAFTNYPSWYELIEEKLALSKYLMAGSHDGPPIDKQGWFCIQPQYELIEEKLALSKYLSWTFVSCHTGKRKPDPDAFIEAAEQLGLSPSDVIFIDDQSRNVEAAIQIGMTGLTFQGAKKLQRDLLALGVLL